MGMLPLHDDLMIGRSYPMESNIDPFGLWDPLRKQALAKPKRVETMD
jgi:hypothetical protein